VWLADAGGDAGPWPGAGRSLPGISHPGFYPPDFLLGILALAVLVDLLAASVGVLVLLRTQTVRQAQQILSIGTLVGVVGGGILFQRLSGGISLSLSGAELFLLIFAALVVIDAVLLTFALLRFQRQTDLELARLPGYTMQRVADTPRAAWCLEVCREGCC